ncbi:MAG: hypothetical protein H8D61_02560 [Deltaproteobacteria bacterium]|nr:hypothetical protein [Deltaproteobacteria bacterium]
MKYINRLNRIVFIFLAGAFFSLAAVSGAAAVDDAPTKLLRQAMRKCRADWKEANESCSAIYIKNYVKKDPEVQAQYHSCIKNRNETFDQCMSYDKLLAAAKFKQFRKINRKVLAQLEKAQDAAGAKYSVAAEKCLKQKTKDKQAKCINKANKNIQKKMAQINKKYRKKLKPVK